MEREEKKGRREGVNERGKRGRETQPLFARKIKKGIKLIYNAKGTGRKQGRSKL